MNPDSIRKIAYTLADILDACNYSKEYSIACNAMQSSNLPKVLRIAYNVKARFYSGEMIAEILHRINAQAYAGRYNEPDVIPLPIFPGRSPANRSLYRSSEYEMHHEIPQEWHYHLANLLDCWLYQTAEDASRDCLERQAVLVFRNNLMREIVQNSPEYNKFRWGE